MEIDAKAEETDDAAAAAPVDRLVLAVHGIGQKLSGANIVDDAATLRALVRRLPSCLLVCLCVLVSEHVVDGLGPQRVR